jgi:hypothetical protein
VGAVSHDGVLLDRGAGRLPKIKSVDTKDAEKRRNGVSGLNPETPWSSVPPSPPCTMTQCCTRSNARPSSTTC